MYTETDDDIECDLMNSFAWDTAIVYIQKCTEDIGYSKANDGNGNQKITGASNDEKCKINDMAKNMYEWTTEYCSRSYHCIFRGGGYEGNAYFVSRRSYSSGGESSYVYFGFRPILYLNNS